MENNLKPYLSLIFAFTIGSITGWSCLSFMKHKANHSFLTTESRLKALDPYKYNEALKQFQLDAYFKSLPPIVQTAIAKTDPNFEKLASCTGDFVPHTSGSFAVSYLSGNKSKVFVFAIDGRSDIKATYDLSDLIGFQKNSDDDYLEIQCRHSSFLLSNVEFKLNGKERELAEKYQKSNQTLIQVRSRRANTLGIFAFNDDDEKFHFLGTIPADLRGSN